MYELDDLLGLLAREGAQKLLLSVGSSPALFVQGEEFEIQAPPMTAENADVIVRSIAGTRQLREIREHGKADFISKKRGRRFLFSVVTDHAAHEVEVRLLKG